MVIIYGIFNTAAVVFALIAYRISRISRLEKARGPEIPDLLSRAMKKAGKYGISKKSDLLFYMLMPSLGLLAGCGFLLSGKLAEALLLSATPFIFVLMMIAARKRQTASVFQKNAYKLYKYILNQTASGVRPGDALKSMYEVVEEKKLRRILAEACAKYSVSMDNEILSYEILENIDTPEARSFAMTIRDRLFESRDEKLIGRLEQLMFNRYFAYIQRATDGVKTRCLVTVVLLCAVIVIMILIPTMLDVQNALNSIFSQ